MRQSLPITRDQLKGIHHGKGQQHQSNQRFFFSDSSRHEDNSMTAIHERLRDALNNKEMKAGEVIEYPCEGKTPKKAVAALNAFLKDRVTPKPKVSLHADPTRTDVVLIMKK